MIYVIVVPSLVSCVWFAILGGGFTVAVAAVLLWAGGLSALESLVVLVAGPSVLVLIGVCVSLMKALRKETFESALPSPNGGWTSGATAGRPAAWRRHTATMVAP